MAIDTHLQPAPLSRPADVCRARAAEARTFAVASCGNDVLIWLEVAAAWDLAVAVHEQIDAHNMTVIGDPVAVADLATRHAQRLAVNAFAAAA